MFRQQFEQVTTTLLHGQQQQTQKIQEGEGRIDAHVGGGAADFLHRERGVGRGQAGGEDQVGLVGGSQVRGEEVGEDGAGGVEGSGVGCILQVPFILEFGQSFCAVLGAERQMALRVVGFCFYTHACRQHKAVIISYLPPPWLAAFRQPKQKLNKSSLTLREQRSRHMMQFRVSIGVLPALCTPGDHLRHIFLLRRLVRWERPQQIQQFPFRPGIHWLLRLAVYLDKLHA